MPNVTANNIRIEYDTFGDASSPPLLLVMGLGAQMIMWEEGFCEMLAGRGFYVIRFDNRDVGLSSKFEDAGVPDIMTMFNDPQATAKLNIPYTLDDMAADAVGLLDALNIEKAHLFGMSMGGMIVQTIAIRYPSRVLSLTSMSSGPGDSSLPLGTPEVMMTMVTPPPTGRSENIEYSVKLFTLISGSKYRSDEQVIRDMVERSYDRCYYPQGMARQTIAVLVSGDRTQTLKKISVPTLVIHGSEDPLLPIEHGRATADAVPGAELLVIEGMGHECPADAWPILTDAVVRHTQKAGVRSA